MQHISKTSDEVMAFRKRWAEALTSGEFTRCEGTLARDGGHCCLGVAYVVATGKPVPPRDDTGEREAAYRLIFHKAGIDHDDAFETCVKWNDQEHLSFAEIARKILGGELEAS